LRTATSPLRSRCAERFRRASGLPRPEWLPRQAPGRSCSLIRRSPLERRGMLANRPVQRRLVSLLPLALATSLTSALLAPAAPAAGAAARAVGAVASPAADCQPFGQAPCLLPFPSNLFTKRDRSTPTGLRVQLP